MGVLSLVLAINIIYRLVPWTLSTVERTRLHDDTGMLSHRARSTLFPRLTPSFFYVTSVTIIELKPVLYEISYCRSKP